MKYPGRGARSHALSFEETGFTRTHVWVDQGNGMWFCFALHTEGDWPEREPQLDMMGEDEVLAHIAEIRRAAG